LSQLKIERTWTDDDWILHDVLIDEKKVDEIGKYLSEGPWYIHFWKPGEDKIIVVFRDKTFEISHSNKSTWLDAIQYGKSIGIPEERLDFIIG